MQAVILAGGKGKRLGVLTNHVPKPMLQVLGRPILEHVLDALPDVVDEVVLAIGHNAHIIEAHFGASYKNKHITYVYLTDLNGTASALWQTRTALRPEPFLVVFGDDIRAKTDLERIASLPLGFGTHHGVANHAGYSYIEADEAGNLSRFRPATPEEVTNGVTTASGVFMLDERIFTYEPVRIANGEFGLPHTMLSMAKDVPIPLVPMDFWIPITYPEDIQRAEEALGDL